MVARGCAQALPPNNRRIAVRTNSTTGRAFAGLTGLFLPLVAVNREVAERSSGHDCRAGSAIAALPRASSPPDAPAGEAVLPSLPVQLLAPRSLAARFHLPTEAIAHSLFPGF